MQVIDNTPVSGDSAILIKVEKKMLEGSIIYMLLLTLQVGYILVELWQWCIRFFFMYMKLL